MSKYTTGELAKLCGVTVRTVQYYDTRNILVPSELSEGGRRLYSEDDLKRMKIICFLRELDLPISAIAQLLAEDHPENVIDLLLDQQEQLMRTEIAQRQERLDKLLRLKQERKFLSHFSVEAIGGNPGNGQLRLRPVHRHLVALSVGSGPGHRRQHLDGTLLLSKCAVHLPPVPHHLQAQPQGDVLGSPHPQHPEADLHCLRPQGLLRGNLRR